MRRCVQLEFYEKQKQFSILKEFACTVHNFFKMKMNIHTQRTKCLHWWHRRKSWICKISSASIAKLESKLIFTNNRRIIRQLNCLQTNYDVPEIIIKTCKYMIIYLYCVKKKFIYFSLQPLIFTWTRSKNF